MDAMPCHWNGASDQDSFQRPKTIASTLSRLAELIARVEHKQEARALKAQQSGPSIHKDCGPEFPDPGALDQHQQRAHALCQPHCCAQCGMEFTLVSTVQLHRCPDVASACQVCGGQPQRGSECPSCQAQAPAPQGTEEPPKPPHLHHRLHPDGGPYACALCGRDFGHKQELLYHQQVGGCQPAPLSPKAEAPHPPPVPALSPDHAPTPSQASLPLTPSGTGDSRTTCVLCLKTLRSVAGLASHQRLAHPNRWKSQKAAAAAAEIGTQAKGSLFPCRSCDMVFSHTSTLYLHRKEEHRRETPVPRQQRGSVKSTRQRRRAETYPCLHCGKVFLHHLTRWAHFKSYSTHYQTHLANSGKLGKTLLAGKAAKDLKAPKGLKTAPSTKLCKEESVVLGDQNYKGKKRVAFRARRREGRSEEEGHGEEREFPCPSCAEIFGSRASLREHEEVHRSSLVSNLCSVCTGGITLPETKDAVGTRVYHCVPCREAFVDLDGFLQHCQIHLHHSEDEEHEKDSDQLSDD